MKFHPPNRTLMCGNLMNIANTRAASFSSDHCNDNDAGNGTEGANALNIVEGQRSHA